MKNIIIIGSRGYKSEYGGWETFVTNLIDNYYETDTKFYVPELSFNKKDQVHLENGVECQPIITKPLGSITMMIFAYKAVLFYKNKIKKDKLSNVIIYILGCRFGPLFSIIYKKLNKMGVTILINPDGLEWKREKWNYLIKQYFKLSEKTMVKSSDYVICDSLAIEEYIKEKYQTTKTNFIAYGAYINDEIKENLKITSFINKYNIRINNYYLVVARFVPENNLETIIKEFMKTNINKDLVIISNYSENKFYNHLKEVTEFFKDERIKFVGPMYDDEVLRYIRKNTIAYIHGHSAGGTNPSLLEALSITNVNLLYDVVYNKEVGQDAALYWTKEADSLKKLLEKVDNFSIEDKKFFGKKAKDRINKSYTWNIVANKYQELFNNILEGKR